MTVVGALSILSRLRLADDGEVRVARPVAGKLIALIPCAEKVDRTFFARMDPNEQTDEQARRLSYGNPPMKTMSDTTTILVIDRDPLILTGMGAILDQQGFHCWGARGSEAALKFIATGTPDLIICDTHLGDECGLELVAKLLQRMDLVGTPVIFTSSSAHADLIDRTRSIGGSYYLRKPFDPYVLLELVDKALWLTALVQTRIDRGAHEHPGPKEAKMFQKSRASS